MVLYNERQDLHLYTEYSSGWIVLGGTSIIDKCGNNFRPGIVGVLRSDPRAEVAYIEEHGLGCARIFSAALGV